MKISINNFKSIEDLVKYELKPLTIISGVNSSGKSSFIQLLLLLKQTIERNSSDEQLYLSGDLYKVRKFSDILSAKNFENKLRVEFEFSKEEDLKVNSDKRISIFDSFQDYNITVTLIYDFIDGKIFISEFAVKYLLPEGEKKEQFLKCFAKNETGKVIYTIEANNNLFGKDLWNSKPIDVSGITYSSIFPWYYQIQTKEEKDSPNSETADIYQETLETIFFNLDGIKDLIDLTFKSFNYIGPVRQEPRDDYSFRDEHKSVGTDGSFVSQVLENNSKTQIEFFKPTFSESGEVAFTKIGSTLLEAVKYWMCDIFKIGTDIYVEKTNDVYIIYLVGEKGIKTTIKHVGLELVRFFQ